MVNRGGDALLEGLELLQLAREERALDAGVAAVEEEEMGVRGRRRRMRPGLCRRQREVLRKLFSRRAR